MAGGMCQFEVYAAPFWPSCWHPHISVKTVVEASSPNTVLPAATRTTNLALPARPSERTLVKIRLCQAALLD